MRNSRDSEKLVDDFNFVYRIDRKYSEETNWKCENRECKARVHSMLENDNLFIS